MVDSVRGSLPIPAFSMDATDSTHVEILASTEGLVQMGRTILSGQGVIGSGRAMARQTTTKKWVVYNNAGSNGADVCTGILRDAVDTTNGDVQGNIVFAGSLKWSLLYGVDANAVTDLNGRYDAYADLFVF